MSVAPLRNWAGNHLYGARQLHHPESVEQVQELVRRLPRVKVLGSRHSFNDIADTGGDLIALDRLPRIIDIDRARRVVRIDGGVRYGDLCGPLDRAGFALHSLASLPHISVAGACATGSHGSGDRTANLATAVTALEVVTGDGRIVRFSREDDADALNGAVVSLGGLGVVTQLELEIRPTYAMRQDVYEDVPWPVVAARLDEIMAAEESVSLFTEWRSASFEQLWLKRVVPEGADAAGFRPEPMRFGARLATLARHPIPGMSPVTCTEQLGVAGPWHTRLPHFRMEHTPSAGDELQTEYLVPRPRAAEAVASLMDIRDRLAPLVQISELRTVAADGLWMSMCHEQASLGVHFTWVPDGPAVARMLPVIEELLAPFEARPHWGKLFTTPPDRLRSLYERLPAFRGLLLEHDPEGKFRNAFLDRHLLDPI